MWRSPKLQWSSCSYIKYFLYCSFIGILNLNSANLLLCPCQGVRHDAGDIGVRLPGFSVARQPRRADDVRAGRVGAARSRRRLRQRQDLQELRRPEVEEQYTAHFHGVSRVCHFFFVLKM